MKFMDKVKNFFTEEVEEEIVPIKKEVIQVEIPSPDSSEKEKIKKEEPKEIVKEEKKASPVYFDDKDFLDLEKNDKKIEQQKSRSNQNKDKKFRSSFLKKEEPVIEGYNGKEKSEKKVFKPSPIISPVYGVLDKNYSKDDIVSKGETKRIKYSNVNEVTIDDVRKKAFGTLEDDLESNLFNDLEITKTDDGLFDELKDDEKVKLDVEEVKNTKDIDEFINEEGIHQDYYSDEELEAISDDNIVDDEIKNITEEIDGEISHIDQEIDGTEDDLFNLIDSMYDKKEDE